MAALDFKNQALLLGALDNVLLYNLKEDCCLKYDLPIVPTAKKQSSSYVTFVALSESCQTLAVVTNNKEFLIYTKHDNEYNLTCTHVLPRAASAMKFSHQSEKLLIADKAGDAFISQKESSWTPTLILSQLSILLDVLITPDDKFIISCDRDEKIRVNSYPDTFNIISYCLGHEEFVSALGLLAIYPDVLFSVSGDRTLRSWHYITGQQLIVVRLPHSATAMKLAAVSNGIHAIVSYHNVNQINVYNFTFNENKCMVCELSQCIDLSAVPAGFSVFGKNIWFSCLGYLLEYLYNPDKKKYVKSERTLCKELLDFIAITDRCELDDFISSLFKKHYNNLEEYHKKKQMRMSKDLSVTAS